MALNPAIPANAIKNSYLNLVTTPPYTGNLGTTWGQAFLTWSTQGTLSGGGGVAGSEDPSIITNFVGSLTGNTNPDVFAEILAQYWATCLLIPSGNAVSVVNDAATKVPAFRAAFSATITDQDTKPYFETLFSNIQGVALPQITWTVSRVVGGVPTVTLETVS